MKLVTIGIMTRLIEVFNYLHVGSALLKNKKYIYMSYTCHVFSFEERSALLQRMPCGVKPIRGRILPAYPSCRKRPLKGSMLKVNLLFIVKKVWLRQPLNGEYVTFPADRSSQQRPANITTFGEPLAQPSDVS